MLEFVVPAPVAQSVRAVDPEEELLGHLVVRRGGVGRPRTRIRSGLILGTPLPAWTEILRDTVADLDGILCSNLVFRILPGARHVDE